MKENNSFGLEDFAKATLFDASSIIGGAPVVDAFYRIYGIDIKKAGCLNMVELDVERIG